MPLPSAAPLYTLNTPFIPGLEPEPLFTLRTSLLPGVELPLDAGPDDIDETYLPTTLSLQYDSHLDETYLPTTRSGPEYIDGDFGLDETFETTSVTVSVTVDVSAITFFPVRRNSTVQSLTTLLVPGADQDVTFGTVRNV